MAAFVAKQMIGNKMSAVKGMFILFLFFVFNHFLVHYFSYLSFISNTPKSLYIYKLLYYIK